ncbi:DUF4192 domain-containing protein [Nocardia brasiliensis]|uniref:DUF4192 domain-containing protein n=1 Tax=Nocardia brasiliensis TaxID=37326 RepID=UPI0004A6D6B1|nr:DUF4192 domain-containing protein [Nocardia brasiliensis]
MPSIENPAAFIAQVLAAVGRPLERSVVLVGMHLLGCWPDTHIRPRKAIVTDLYLTYDDRLSGDYLATTPIIARAIRFCQLYKPDALAAVVVDTPRPHRPVPRATHRELMATLRECLAEADTDLLDAWVLSGTGAGQPWASLIDADHGTLPALAGEHPGTAAAHPDPPTAPPSVLLHPDPDFTHQVEGHLTALGTDQGETSTAADETAVGSAAVRREQLRFVLTRLRAADSGTDLTAADLARVAVILDDEELRSCLLAVSSGPRAGACSSLWTQLVRALPAPRRAHAATLLAVTAYARGDTAGAASAIEIALADAPDDSFAATLATAFACPIPPAMIASLFRPGQATAAELGIDLD